MESIVYKTDFSYFVRMALESNIPWKSLSMILKDLTPTLIETREVISILLKELEALQSTLKMKDKELALKDKTIQENVEQNSMPERKTIEDEIEVLEVVKESMNDDILLDMNKGTKSNDELVNDDHDDDSGNDEESMDEIDNEWYTFHTVLAIKKFFRQIKAKVATFA